MSNKSSLTKLYDCPACDFEAENEAELSEHFELKSGDKEHKEYSLDPQDKEVLNENNIEPPAVNPGNPSSEEGTE